MDRSARDLWVAEAKAATIADAVARLGLNLKRSGSELTGPCPLCGGTDRFAINPVKGAWLCRQCRPHGGSAIDLVMHCEGGDFLSACAVLNGTAPPWRDNRPQSEAEIAARKQKRAEIAARMDRERKADEGQRIESARSIWLASGELSGAGLVYLESRGIDPGFADEQIRFHKGLPHPSGGSFPAIVARVCGPEGNGVGVWRIYLKMDGRGKAPVDNAKLGLGVVAGGAVRIGGIWPTLAVAEGIETALAVRELLPGGLPCWAALSTSGMAGLVVPDEVERVDIFADGDPPKSPQGRRDKWLPSPGLTAANHLKARLEAAGKRADIHVPPLNSDWLDVLAQSKKLEVM